jgi:hypothetical protein
MVSGSWKLEGTNYHLKFTPGLVSCLPPPSSLPSAALGLARGRRLAAARTRRSKQKPRH